MDAQALIEANNEKRKLLTEENLKWYEDMLIYIRLSYDKSEQETEEVLTEILDHLLEAQEDGKTIEDVFGSDPKAYANEIIGELPKMITKKRISFFAMCVFYFIGTVALFNAIVDFVIHYGFDKGELVKEYYLGTQITKLVVSIPVSFLLLGAVIYYLRWACFRNINKIKEFFILWVFGIFSVGIFMLILYITPDFGVKFEWSAYYSLIAGVVLNLIGRWIYKRL